MVLGNEGRLPWRGSGVFWNFPHAVIAWGKATSKLYWASQRQGHIFYSISCKKKKVLGKCQYKAGLSKTGIAMICSVLCVPLDDLEPVSKITQPCGPYPPVYFRELRMFSHFLPSRDICLDFRVAVRKTCSICGLREVCVCVCALA